MDHAVTSMLNRYRLDSAEDYISALREIIQHTALLALWRAKFYEHAAFYGGTALRIFYGLPRFSEDLDFSLMAVKRNFSLDSYLNAIEHELTAFGFSVDVLKKEKRQSTAIESAFIKTGTLRNFLSVAAPRILSETLHRNSVLKVRIEIDVEPPPYAEFEMKELLLPIPHHVRLYTRDCIFAGKIHALLCRTWKTRVKGRDFYDFIWFIGQAIPCNLKHLQARMVQSGHLTAGTVLNRIGLVEMLNERFRAVNIGYAKKDISPFIDDPQGLDLWDRGFFCGLADKLKVCN